MSGTSEATAVMTNREPFSMNSPPPVMNPVASQPQLEHQMHMNYMNSDGGAAFGSSPQPFQSIPAGATETSSDQKRKRGRPRKYGPDGSMNVSLGSPHQPIHAAVPHQQSQNFSSPSAPAAVAPLSSSLPPMDGSSSPTTKKARGRARGSKNKVKHHSEALGSVGIGFVPHILNVNAGEDVSSKIMAICQNGPRAVCVLSANGAISTVTLRQAATSGGTATYEGRFDILSLSGSFMLTEVAGQKSRTGGLSVALAGPDGSVLGGSVAGLLVAASPAQVIVGSFLPDGQKEVSTNYVELSSAQRVNLGGGGVSSSPSRGTLSESSGGGPASPLNLSSGVYNNINQGMSGIPWK